jgi:signal transduction histidine kinase
MRWLAPFGVLAYLLLASAGFSLQVLAQSQFGSFSIAVQIPFYFLVGVWVALGALIVWHHPENRIGWLLSLVMPLVALDLLAFGYVTYEATTNATSLLGAAALVWLRVTGMPFGMLIFAIALLLFPNVRFLSPRWRLAAWVAVASFLAYLPLKALEPGSLILVPDRLVPDAGSPLAVSEARWALLRPLMWLALLSLTLAMGTGLLSLLLRFRRAYGEERQQIKWLVAPAFLFFLGVPVVVYGESASSQAIFGLGSGMHMLAVTGMMVAMAIAIFKYRLYDIDIIINRTLVYGVLTVSVVVIYVLIVGGLGALLQAEGNLLISLVATGFVAVLFQPLRQRLQRAVNHFMYGERDDPFEALARLGRRLEGIFSPQMVYPTIVETVAQALKLPYAAIAVKRGEQYEIVEASGDTTREPVVYPLVHQGEVIGRLLVGRRGSGEDFSKADERLLRSFARQAGTAVHAVQLMSDLQRSRQQLVTAREEERLRLRRDLHDGLGPALASVAWQAESARELVHADPPEAVLLLESTIEQAQSALTDIRRLVYGLRPPALDELGLVGALEQAVRPQQMDVTIEAPAVLPTLPAAVEVAAYRIVREALKNAVEHGRAGNCVVCLALDGHLRLTIGDDGQGLPEVVTPGVGLVSMRERAEELGGTFAIRPRQEGGTEVEVSLPLESGG